MAAIGIVREPKGVHDAANVLELRRGLAVLAAELDEIAAASAQHATSGADCMDALNASAEKLVVELARDSPSSEHRMPVNARDSSLVRRRAQLEEEICTLERRAARQDNDANSSLNGGTWAASFANREQALAARLRQAEAAAEASQTAAEMQAQEHVRVAEAYLAELRESRRELETSCNTAGEDWRTRFGNFVVTQNFAADLAARDAECSGADPGSSRLDSALTAALHASQQRAYNTSSAGCTAGSLEATAVAAAQCVMGMAEAERRRRGLLVAAWRKLRGEDPFRNATGQGAVVPVDQVFTPRQTRDWDLDMSSIAPKSATPSARLTTIDGLRRL
jgi:hypothetical protein